VIWKSHVFDEPLLEFGDGGQHLDPRQGLREYGPLQPLPGDVVRVGVIGTEETVGGFTEFLAETARGIESGNKQLINLNPDFPGLGNQNPFRCEFVVPDGATATLTWRQVSEIKQIGRHDQAVRHTVELIASQVSALTESSAKPDVIVLALPVPLIEKLVNAKSEEELESAEEEGDSGDDTTLNFRDLLKAKTLHLNVPTQLVWPDTWDDAAKIPRKVKRDRNRETQAKATRAWNLLNALFYKAGKVPWRLLPNRGEYLTSFLGIGFYRDLDGQQLWTSTAQMFDERGRGLILRGARAQTETKGRHPYLTASDAEALVEQSITIYRTHHRHVPARVVVLKTSRFRPEEAEGIGGSAEKVQYRDGRSSLGPGEFADRSVPGRELPGPSRYVCRVERQGPALHARQRALLRHLSGPARPPATAARTSRAVRQLDPHAGEGRYGAHKGELEHDAVRSKTSRPDQGGAGSRTHSRAR
jgi:hypothetical protein